MLIREETHLNIVGRLQYLTLGFASRIALLDSCRFLRLFTKFGTVELNCLNTVWISPIKDKFFGSFVPIGLR